MIVGIGLGIMYVGVLRLLRFLREYISVTTQRAELGEKAYEMAVELVTWSAQDGIFLLIFGLIFLGLGLWYKKLQGRI